MSPANDIARPHAGLRARFVEKSRVLLSLWPGVARRGLGAYESA